MTIPVSPTRTVRLPHPMVAGYWLAVAIWLGVIASGMVDAASDGKGWHRYTLPNPYQVRSYSSGEGFWFTPPIAFLFYPFTVLPWPLFAATLTAASFVALGYLAGPWAAIALLVPFVWWEISAANVNLVIGAAIAAGFRYPAAWSFVLLTKVTPGLGLVWFAVRREWRSLAIAIGATVLIAAWSFVVSPTLWFTWFDRLSANAGNPGPGYFTIDVPLVARLPVAILLAGWGAHTDRRWTVVVAALLSLPVIWWNSLAMLAAVLPLVRFRSRSSDAVK